MDLILFDMDGVLVDTANCHRRAYQDLWEKCGVIGPPYEDIAGRTTREVVMERLGGCPPSPAAIDDWTSFKQARARSYIASEPVEFPDTVPCIEAFHERGLPLGLATGASRLTVQTILDRLGISRRFCVVITADEVGNGKPDSETYRTAMARAGRLAADTIIVEDSASGLKAAIDSGARTACVRSGLRVDAPLFLGAYTDLREFAATLGVTVE